MLATTVLTLTLALPPRAALASGPASPNGPAPVDVNYVYSLIDNTNVSTDLNDGKSWLVRYYSRLSGAAGDTQATNPNPCQLDATTGKNVNAAAGNNGAINGGPAPHQDCWWELMNAWKNESAHQPGMTASNVTDHIYHLGEVDSNPYVSNPQSLSAAQPGPQNTVMLTIPGAVHPEQTVVIGEHQDGASLSTWGSAYDDGQGAAVLEGVARSMLQYWTSNHLWPARTVQFVLFDGEEEGLFGSFFYESNLMPIGAVDSNLYVGMFNVDQNGIEYPARHLGTPDHPDQGSWFTNINETPQADYSFYSSSTYPRLLTNLPAIQAFHTETAAAVQATFNELGQVYTGKPMPLGDYGFNVAGNYPTDCVTAATAPLPANVNCVDTFQNFATDSQYLLRQDDTLGRTDQDPFIRCGINAFGILGAYDSNAQEPAQLDPLQGIPYAGYDTPVDNVGWLNQLASGRQPASQVIDQSPPNEINPWNPVTNPSGQIGAEALRRALSFAGNLVLNEATDAQMAGVAPTPVDPIAYFLPDRYTAHVGDMRTFSAIPSPVAATTWVWNFGDGSALGMGPTVQHSYTAPGVYTVSLTESAPSGSSTYTASLHVVAAGADANTVCGQVNNSARYATGQDTQYAPTFTNTVQPGTGTPEVPWAPTLVAAGAVVALLEVSRRRRHKAGV
ncbi:MAG TPA: PKD domain-containing protein [Candidatus Acidoferrales bacterium]|nr:PKD domain-containing protein [Candidatus Acidoferrales bacterium]